MDEFKSAGLIIVITILGLSFVLSANFAGYKSGHAQGVLDATEAEQRKAVEAGAGRWVIDANTGEREFVYGVK